VKLIRDQSVLLADAGPFCRFAQAGADQLRAFVEYLGDGLKITSDVAHEISSNAKMPKFAALNQLEWWGWDAEDHTEAITDKHILSQVENIAEGQRRNKERQGKSRRNPWQEKGEVATVLLAKAQGWAVLIDDADGRRLAAAKKVTLFGTEQLSVEMAAVGAITPDQAFSVFTLVRGRDRADFDRRLAAHNRQ
jgi:hypothetical protein